MAELIPTVLKFLAIAISGVAGVVAIVGETRDKEGRLTRWGKLMLAAILLSGMVAAALQVNELIRQRKEAKEAERRARETVAELQSPLMPAERMTVSFNIEMNLDHPKLIAYRNRIAKLLTPALNSNRPPKPPPDTYWWFSDDKVTGIQFGPASPFFPQTIDGPDLPRIFDHFGIEGRIGPASSRDGINFRAFPKDGKRTFRVLSLDENKIEFDIQDVELRPGESWKTDNSIVSLPQLTGKQLTLDFIGFDWGRDSEIDLSLEFQKVSSIQSFKFFVANRPFFLSCGPHELGKPLTYTFPADFLKANINLPCPGEQ